MLGGEFALHGLFGGKNMDIPAVAWSDPTFVVNLMREHGDSDMPFFGRTEDGLDAEVHVYKDKVIVKTVCPGKERWFVCIEYDENGHRIPSCPMNVFALCASIGLSTDLSIRKAGCS